MKSNLGRFNLHWLIAPGASSATPVDESLTIHRMDYQIPAEIGQAWLESLDLSEGLRLYRAVHHLEKASFGDMVPMLDVTALEPEPVFSAQTWLSGMGCHIEYWQGRSQPPVEVWGRPGLDTFRLRSHWDARVLIAGAGLTEMRSVMVSQSLLQALLGDSFESMLLVRLGLDEATKAVTRQMPQRLNTPLLEAMSDQYTGPARRLFAQTKTLEYLGLLVDFLHSEKSTPRQGRHTQKIRELKDYLLSLNGRLPALNSLAADFGLSAKQLNIEFKLEYGQSIFDYVSSNRLEQAHAALLESSMPMKVLSERLGYSHVNHFITAFKRKFAYPPGSLRRKRKKD
jgi:AraC-like DNA-binding protein